MTSGCRDEANSEGWRASVSLSLSDAVMQGGGGVIQTCGRIRIKCWWIKGNCTGRFYRCNYKKKMRGLGREKMEECNG